MKIKLNKEIYNIESINNCAGAYKEICDVDCASSDAYYEVEINNCKYDERETVEEFCNYLIAVLNENS